MATIKANTNGIYGIAKYIAVPQSPGMTKIIGKSSLKDDFFPGRGIPGKVDASTAILVEDDNLTEVVSTFSRKLTFVPKMYELPKESLEGFTTFHFSAISTDKEHAEHAIERVTEMFPNSIDLEMKSDFIGILQNAFPSLLVQFNYYATFFNAYAKMRGAIEHAVTLPNKKVTRGVIYNRIELLFKKIDIDSSNYITMLVGRKKGNYKGIDVELSLIYLDKEGVPPGIYGAIISSKHGKGCPTWETASCDQSRIYSGYFLSPRTLFFGVSSLKPEMEMRIYKDNESGPSKSIDFCLNSGGSTDLKKGLKDIRSEAEEIVKVVKGDINCIPELEALTRLAYDAGQNFK